MAEQSQEQQRTGQDVPARPGSAWQRASFSMLVLAAVVLVVFVAALQNEVPKSALLETAGVGPGTHLQLQTAQGPMQLTVDSQINSAGYVHAYGFMQGQEYAGYVKLSAGNAAAAQVLAEAPSYGQQQLATYPTTSPYTEQVAYAQPQTQQPLQLHISPDGSVSLNGQKVSAADGKTAAVLRLLSKQAAAGGGEGRMSLAQQVSHARERLEQLEEEKDTHTAPRAGRGRAEGRGRGEEEHEPRAAMWAAMKTLMGSVEGIERRQKKMQRTVDKVRKIMRYSPFH